MLTSKILNLPRTTKRLIVLGVDLLLLPLALWASFSLRLGELYVPVDKVNYLFLVLPLIAVPIFGRFGLYRAIIRYIGFKAMWADLTLEIVNRHLPGASAALSRGMNWGNGVVIDVPSDDCG